MNNASYHFIQVNKTSLCVSIKKMAKNKEQNFLFILLHIILLHIILINAMKWITKVS